MKTSLKITLAIFFLLIMIVLFAYKYILPSPVKSLTIAAGREGGMYYQYAQEYATKLQKQGFEVQILKTAGSLENIALLEEGKADIGFVQGGVADAKAKKRLRSIASIFYEPLWLFYDANLSQIHYLHALKGLRYSIGEEGSGTKALINTLFTINALKPQGLTLSTKEAYAQFQAGALDAFFTVSSADSKQIKTLLSDQKLQVATLKRIDAYAQHYSYLSHYSIPEGALSLQKNIPNKPLNLLATTASLVARANLDDILIRFITIQVKKSPQNQGFFPSTHYIDIPMHPAAQKYLLKGESLLEKIFPYWIASNIDRLKYLLIPILTLLIPIFKGIFPLYKWRTRSKIYKWYDDLEQIEKISLDQELLPEKIHKLQKLQQEVNEHTDVPLSYMGELYDLKLHIDNVLVRLTRSL